MNMKTFSSAIICAIIASNTSAYPQDIFTGLCGCELKQTIKKHCTPEKYPESPEKILPSVFDMNIFTGKQYDSPVATFILPPQWWSDDCNVNKDLFNIVAGDNATNAHKQNFPPGTVSQPTFSNNFWSAGIGVIDGIKVNFYNPPKGYEGDFARAIFYTLCIYPNEHWSGLGINFCSDGEYPGLQKWSYRQLKTWNDIDPVDSEEKLRNNKIAEIQGHANPFINHPGLAEHIWGEQSGVPFDQTEDPSVEKIQPLRSSYRITDTYIYLNSPYISDTAQWTINGVPVDTKNVKPSSLGIGIHEFRFMTSTVQGKILIEITE